MNVLYINMLQKIFILAVSALFALQVNAAPTVAASKSEPVKVVLEQFKVSVGGDGKELLATLKAKDDVKPGEVLEYRASYKNVSTKPVSDLVATLPVPSGTQYVAKTAMPSVGAEATIDTVTFAPVPLIGTDKKTIPAKEYKALRWKVPSLKAGDAVVVSMRVKVNQE